MQKLSGWTAFIIVCVSLGMSKYLSLAKQTSLPILETPTEFITSPSPNKPPKQISIAEQTSPLIPKTPTRHITSPSSNKSPKQIYIVKQISSPISETPTEIIAPPSSNKSPKQIYIAKQTSLPISEIPTEIITLRPLSKLLIPSSILEQEVFEQVNEYRVSRHLPPLALDSRISEQARIYSQEMASGQVPFGQEGLELHTEAISNVIPYQGMSVNVIYNLGFADPARTAVNSWLRNPERGVVSAAGEYELTGIGVATNIKGEYYFTQIFIHR